VEAEDFGCFRQQSVSLSSEIVSELSRGSELTHNPAAASWGRRCPPPLGSSQQAFIFCASFPDLYDRDTQQDQSVYRQRKPGSSDPDRRRTQCADRSGACFAIQRWRDIL